MTEPSDGSRKNALLLLLIVPLFGIAIAVGMLVSDGLSRQGAGDSGIQPLGVIMNAPARDFQVTTLEGETVQLSDYQGRVVFLNFWATWCPPCVEELPALQEFASEQGDTGAVVLASNNTESADVIRAYLDENNIDVSDMEILLDADHTIYRQYGILNLPTTYVINPAGIVSAVKFGAFDRETLDSYLAQALSDN